MAGTCLEDVAVTVCRQKFTNIRLSESSVRCYVLVLRVLVVSIFASNFIMQARLHGDVVPRAIGGRLDVSCVKLEVTPN